jgi:uncharacterized protein
LRKKYEKTIDRESAHEVLTKRLGQAAQGEPSKPAARAKTAATPRKSSSRTTAVERQTGRVASGVFNTIVRELMRGILGTPSRRRRR